MRSELIVQTGVAGVALVALALLGAGTAEPSPRPRGSQVTLRAESPLRDARQLLLVVTDEWGSVAGTLQRFERPGMTDAWRADGPPVPVVVGKKGLAWGRGQHAAPPAGPATGPIKREGDATAPAGAFRLGPAFGHAAQAPAALRMPYLNLADNIECVDEVRSSHYNELLAWSSAQPPDWTSSEKMWAEPLYRWGIVVEHNARPTVPAAGSCIFLHIWRGPQNGTAGCTAMAEAALIGVLQWLDPAKQPMLVQLPRDEHARLRAAWGLPPVRK